MPGSQDEPLKGSPKFIRTVALDVTQESEFGPHGKLIESRTFRPDGSLSYRHTYQYSGDEIQTTVFDGTGSEISRTERSGEDMQPFQFDQDGSRVYTVRTDDRRSAPGRRPDNVRYVRERRCDVEPG